MHIKKYTMPRAWPIPRKPQGKQFVAVPSHATSKGISLLYILRDILKIARTRKEVRYMTLNGLVKVNNQIRTDENFPLQVFDSINLEKANINYRLEIVNKKYSLQEISSKEAETKIIKITGKTILPGNKIQMNLNDGQNILSTKDFSVGNSIIFNTKTGKIDSILPLKKNAKIEIILGKHAGEKGTLIGFEELSLGKNYLIKLENSEVSLPYKTILVIA
jgi:small subunit ribosomal protein S4e